MKRIILASLIVLGFFSNLSAENIKRLVLYQDTAFITVERTAVNGVILIDAPADLVQESIVAEPSGTGGTIKSIEVKQGEAPAGRAKDLRDQLEKMMTQLSLKKMQQETIEKQIEIIYDAAGEAKREAAFPKGRLNESLAYIDDRVGALNAKYVKIGNERNDLKTQIRELELLLKDIAERKGYVISIQASGTASVSYAVRNTGWKPEYTVQSWPSKDVLLLEVQARIWQSTGTDWVVEEALVSTGSPSYGIQAPELNPWHISPVRPMKNKVMAESYAKAAPRLNGGSADDYAPPVKATQTSYVIGAAKNIAIPGDGSPRVASLMKQRVISNFSRVSVPKRFKSVYLRAEGDWNGEMPLMAGDYTAFVDGEYCGKGSLKDIEPGEKISLDLGRDEGIRIDRKEKTFSEKTLTGKNRSTRTVSISIENTRDIRTNLKLKDQIPVSDDESVKVELKEAVPSAKPDDEGILNWELSLEPKSKVTVKFIYSVTGLAPGMLD